jgi:hypothetical protein
MAAAVLNMNSPGTRREDLRLGHRRGLLNLTPQELNEAAKVNPFVRAEILSKGKVVYRAAA